MPAGMMNLKLDMDPNECSGWTLASLPGTLEPSGDKSLTLRMKTLKTTEVNSSRRSIADELSAVHSARIGLTTQAQRPPPETPGRLQQSRTNYLNRPTAQRGGGSLQRSG